MISGDEIYVGTELKYVVRIEAEGFDMWEHEFEVDIVRGPKKLHFAKDDMVISDEEFYVCFDTRELGPGRVYAYITAHVPDSDFQDGIRDEVQKIELLILYS